MLQIKKMIHKKMGMVVALILLISFVNALSVSMPYMENKELKLFPGELRDLEFVLQNSGATENIVVRATISEGANITSITDESNLYTVIPGDKVPVSIQIKIPEDFEIGGRHHIKLSFSTQTEGESGVIGFGTGIEQNFDVIIGEEIKEKIEINPGLMVLIIIVLIIIIRIFIKRKRTKKGKRAKR